MCTSGEPGWRVHEEFFGVFLQLLCKFEIIPKYKVRGKRGKKLNFIIKVVGCSLKKLQKWKYKENNEQPALHKHGGTMAYILIHLLPVSSLQDLFLILRWAFSIFEMFHNHTFINIHNIPFMKARIIVSS